MHVRGEGANVVGEQRGERPDAGRDRLVQKYRGFAHFWRHGADVAAPLQTFHARYRAKGRFLCSFSVRSSPESVQQRRQISGRGRRRDRSGRMRLSKQHFGRLAVSLDHGFQGLPLEGVLDGGGVHAEVGCRVKNVDGVQGWLSGLFVAEYEVDPFVQVGRYMVAFKSLLVD